VEGIASRLGDRFRLLTGGPRVALPRQKTLRATLDWSFALLSTHEQILLPRLSVFAGGWTLEAAEAVGTAEGVTAPEVLDLLAGLVRKSLVLLEERQAQGSTMARYRLLDTVRQYGQELLLASGTADGVQTRFREWCLELAAQAEVGIEGSEQRVWSTLIEAELDNLRSVLAQGITDAAATETALRLATALRWFWPLYDHVDEGRWWLKVLLAAGSGVAMHVRAPAIYTSGRLADIVGDHEQAHPLYALCVPMFRELGDMSFLAYALHWLSWHAYRVGDSARGAALREESLHRFRTSGDKQGFAVVLSVLGNDAHGQSDYARAAAFWEEARDLFKELGIPWNRAMLALNLGEVALVRGDYVAAQAHYQEGLTLLQEIRSIDGIIACHCYLGEVAAVQGELEEAMAWFQQGLALCQNLDQSKKHVPSCLEGLGNVARLRGDHRQAVAWIEAALQGFREVGLPGPLARALTDLGHAVCAAGDGDRALTLYRESLMLLGAGGYKPHLIRNLEGVATIAATQGRPERAALLFACAASAREAIGAPLPPSEREVREHAMPAVRAALGEAASKAAWGAGQTHDLAMGVADALEVGSSRS
jgi:tetratricopeptide (TPR) repeat protein